MSNGVDIKLKRSRLSYLFLCGIVITIILYMMKWLLGITLLKEEWYEFIIAIDCILFLLSIGKTKYRLKYLVNSIVVIVIILCCVQGYISREYTSYYYMYSPNEQHKLVLKAYNKGTVSPDGYLEVYNSYFWLLKKSICKTIIVPDTAPVMGPEPKYEEAPFVEGAIRHVKVYDSFFFLFEWINEDTVLVKQNCNTSV